MNRIEKIAKDYLPKKTKEWQRGQVLFTAGKSEIDGVYLVVDGEFEVTR